MLGSHETVIASLDERSKKTRMSALQISIISERLKNLRSSIPNVFAYKPRNLELVDRWKATKFRQFLLCTGKIVLKEY